MPLNYLRSKLCRPRRGWDPIKEDYARSYAQSEWANLDTKLIDDLEDLIGGFAGKTVLDLGGGPGHYSVAFAKRGASVVWHDVSANYLSIARHHALQNDVEIEFSLGYLDEARKRLDGSFDFVFNRICWLYAFDDTSFARMVYKLVKPGGACYVDTMHSGWLREKMSNGVRFRSWLNDRWHLKIGHPWPPRGRVGLLFAKRPLEKLIIDYTSPSNDKVFFVKCRS